MSQEIIWDKVKTDVSPNITILDSSRSTYDTFILNLVVQYFQNLGILGELAIMGKPRSLLNYLSLNWVEQKTPFEHGLIGSC